MMKKPIARPALTLAFIVVQADEKLLAPKSGFFGGEHSLSHLNAAKLLFLQVHLADRRDVTHSCVP